MLSDHPIGLKGLGRLLCRFVCAGCACDWLQVGLHVMQFGIHAAVRATGFPFRPGRGISFPAILLFIPSFLPPSRRRKEGRGAADRRAFCVLRQHRVVGCYVRQLSLLWPDPLNRVLKNRFMSLRATEGSEAICFFFVGNPRLLRRFAPPASPGEAGAGLAMTNPDFIQHPVNYYARLRKAWLHGTEEWSRIVQAPLYRSRLTLSKPFRYLPRQIAHRL
jgi:hypothetical protein